MQFFNFFITQKPDLVLLEVFGTLSMNPLPKMFCHVRFLWYVYNSIQLHPGIFAKNPHFSKFKIFYKLFGFYSSLEIESWFFSWIRSLSWNCFQSLPWNWIRFVSWINLTHVLQQIVTQIKSFQLLGSYS